MSDDAADVQARQEEVFKGENVRLLLDQLLADSRLYRHGKDYKALLDFVVRLRNFAPFNAMLLQVQRPGLSYAASARDWRERFGRSPKDGTRPLLILWPFGPVALVYDVMDTEGDPIPEDVASFVAHGPMDQGSLRSFQPLLKKKGIDWIEVDAGDKRAGSIRVIKRAPNDEEFTQYRMHINRNHEPAVQFVTLVHELAHLFLGHLGANKKLNVPQRHVPEHAHQELEAESVAFIVCERQGVKSKSQTYLSNFVNADTAVEQLDVYQVMRVAGQVETLLRLAAHTNFGLPARPTRDQGRN
jgi:hypothetical protein